MSTDEKITAVALGITVALWIFGGAYGINAVAAALTGLAILLITGVVSWKQCLSDNQAWDTLTWFAALIAMAAYLNKFGFISWFSGQVVGVVGGMGLSWQAAFGLITTLYFYSHYFFASGAAHIGAMYTAFLSVAIACGTPGLLAALALGACWVGGSEEQQQHDRSSSAAGGGAPASVLTSHVSMPCPPNPAPLHPCRPAVQRDGLPHHLRHRLRAALLRHRVRAPGQVVPPGRHLLRRLPLHLGRRRRRLVEGPGPLVGGPAAAPAPRRPLLWPRGGGVVLLLSAPCPRPPPSTADLICFAPVCSETGTSRRNHLHCSLCYHRDWGKMLCRGSPLSLGGAPCNAAGNYWKFGRKNLACMRV